MTSTQKEESLETDPKRRIRFSRARREAFLDEFEKSGLSAVRFARLAGLRYSTFTAWQQERRKKRSEKDEVGTAAPDRTARSGMIKAPIRLLEASVESDSTAEAVRAPAPAGLSVELPGGARLRVESPLQLRLAAELISLISQTLRRPC
jgi:hypothetical protein